MTETPTVPAPLLSTRQRLLRLAVGVVAMLAPMVAGTVSPAAAQAAEVVTRVRGEDRVATSAAVALAGWERAPRVLVATARNYPDAIAASAFAASLDAPVLLTEPDDLPDVVHDALDRLGTRHATILGGPGAVSDDVLAELRSRGMVVDRVAGRNRWQTAAELAREVAMRGPVEVVALALGDRGDGKDAWPDALAAASLAALAEPVPTVLTGRAELPYATRQALEELAPRKVLVLGGEAAVPQRVVDELVRLGYEVERLDGPNRFATSVAVANEAMAGPSPEHGELDPTRLVAVSGEGFADALGAGALAARRGAPLVLVPSGRLADSVDAFVRGSGTDFSGATVVGGPKAVTDFVVEELTAAIMGEPRPTPPPACDPKHSSPDCKYTYRHSVETWERLAHCESHGNWQANTGNGYYGGLQFHPDTWRSVGGSGLPHQHSKWEQIHRGEILQERSGWGQWPHCSRELGYR